MVQQSGVSIDDLRAALRRRGPDSLGTETVTLTLQSSKISTSVEELHNCSNGESNNRTQFPLLIPNSVAELHFIGATLQLRGSSPISQPFLDSYGNILVYNGKFFFSSCFMFCLHLFSWFWILIQCCKI